jgi:hypothetical protein
MVDLTPQEAACIWLIHRELISENRDELIAAFEKINTSAKMSDDTLVKMATAYINGMNKLSDFMRGSVNVRDWLKVIQGGKHD